MLNYGRESLRKNANLICFNFYKNVLLTFPVFYFGYHTGMSGATFYETTLNLQLYNVAYTSFPIIVYALWDQEKTPAHFEKHPYLYVAGRSGQVFTKAKFMRWIVFAAIESFLIFNICVEL